MKSELIEKMTVFLAQRGISSHFQSLEDGDFLPGIKMDQGALLIDVDKLAYPGDILHEAGHIAVSAPAERANLSGKITASPADEMAAMAWSFAAAVALEIDPHIVFHEHGYKKGGAHLVAQYTDVAENRNPVAPGVPMLQWYRMCQKFPIMNSWLREIEDPTAA
jgi:hypothetical protein